MKRTTVHHGKIPLLVALMGVFLTSPASSFAQPATIAVRGKIASLAGQELVVSSADGDVKTILTDKTVIRAETPIKLSEISSGMYLGTTATKQADGTFLASEVHVFSEDQRGTGEGHRPLGSAPQSGATMTNANVEHVEDVEIKDIKGRLSASSTKTAQSKSWCRRTFHSLSASAAIEARLKVASRCHCKQLKPQTVHWRQLRLRCAPKDDESGGDLCAHPVTVQLRRTTTSS